MAYPKRKMQYGSSLASLEGAEIMAQAYVAKMEKEREKPMAAKMSPSSLQMLITEVEKMELSQTKKDTIRALAEAELERRDGENMFREFRNWIRKGDQILSEVESELAQLRSLSSPAGEYISRDAALEVLKVLFSDDESDRYDKGRNWVLRQAIKGIEKLPGKAVISQ